MHDIYTSLHETEKRIQKIFVALDLVAHACGVLREAVEGIEAKQQSIQSLTKRELQILEGMAKKLSTREIAKKLGIDKKTIYAHGDNIRMKLGFKSMDELRANAMKKFPA